jgi:hypothetical protein
MRGWELPRRRHTLIRIWLAELLPLDAIPGMGRMKKIALLLCAFVSGFSLSYSSVSADEGKRATPINLPINTKSDEDDPYVSSSGLVLFYASNAKGKFDIMLAKRRSLIAAWVKGQLLEDYVRTEVDDCSVCLTRDGAYPQYLYFATKKDKETKNFDIYVAVKQTRTGSFTEPTPVHAVDSEADEMHPWLTADGKQLYFSRKTKDGWRVYVCKRAQATGAQGFEDPELVKELSPNFHHVSLTRDGKTMYLQGPLDRGRVGLFTSTKGAKGWSEPVALSMLNDRDAPKGDCSPAVSSDGNTLYFASDRTGGKGGFDIWSVPTSQLRLRK